VASGIGMGIQPGFSSEYWWKSRRINEADFVMG
jgi:hypothetical protein